MFEPVVPRRSFSAACQPGYCATLAGPPTIGVFGNHLTAPRTLIVVAAVFGGAVGALSGE